MNMDSLNEFLSVRAADALRIESLHYHKDGHAPAQSAVVVCHGCMVSWGVNTLGDARHWAADHAARCSGRVELFSDVLGLLHPTEAASPACLAPPDVHAMQASEWDRLARTGPEEARCYRNAQAAYERGLQARAAAALEAAHPDVLCDPVSGSVSRR